MSAAAGIRRGQGTSAGRRLDIQGLRAVAVLAVMAAHAELPVAGGFVGVDMFFVISGFIITLTLLKEESRNGRISVRAFFVRRFRRLAPALCAAVAGTLLLSVALLSPHEQTAPGVSVGIGAMLLAANYAVERASGNYFGPIAEQAPLTHVWSLSVEEQFYLVFPFLMIVLLGWRRIAPGRLGGLLRLFALAGLGLASLLAIRGVAGVFASGVFPTGYYGPLSRAWEFLAGVVLAWLGSAILVRRRWLVELTAMVGAALVVGSFLLIGPFTPFPGKATIPVVAGTVLLLWAGGAGQSLVGRLLGSRPMVAIGDWSYSLYLWHWPMAVIAKAMWPLSDLAPVLATAAAFLPAYVSFRFIETPTRSMHGKKLAITGSAWLAVAWVMILVGALSVAAWRPVTDGLANDNPMLGQPCSDRGANHSGQAAVYCHETHPGAEPQILVLGDSHAERAYNALVASYPDTAVRELSVHGGFFFTDGGLAAMLLDELAAAPPEALVVVSARSWLSDQIRPGYTDFLQAVVDVGADRPGHMIILDDNPVWEVSTFQCAVRKAPILDWRECSWPRQHFVAQFAATEAALQGIRMDDQQVTVASSFWATCDDERCYRELEGHPLYDDANHLSQAGGLMQHDYLLRTSPGYARAMAIYR